MTTGSRPRLVHVTTTDISLVLLLGPQLAAFGDAGYDVIGVSAPGPYVPRLEELGVQHVPLRNATRSVAPVKDVSALFEPRHVRSGRGDADDFVTGVAERGELRTEQQHQADVGRRDVHEARTRTAARHDVAPR